MLFRSESGGPPVGGPEGSAAEGRRSRLLSTHTVSSHTKREHHSSAESFASAEDQVHNITLKTVGKFILANIISLTAF